MSSQSALTTIATIGIDLGKNTFHLVGLDRRGAIVSITGRNCRMIQDLDVLRDPS